MNLATISFAYLRVRSLTTALNVLLLALGIATITLLLLATDQLEERMQYDIEVDLLRHEARALTGACAVRQVLE